jgi:hypothetical protein
MAPSMERCKAVEAVSQMLNMMATLGGGYFQQNDKLARTPPKLVQFVIHTLKKHVASTEFDELRVMELGAGNILIVFMTLFVHHNQHDTGEGHIAEALVRHFDGAKLFFFELKAERIEIGSQKCATVLKEQNRPRTRQSPLVDAVEVVANVADSFVDIVALDDNIPPDQQLSFNAQGIDRCRHAHARTHTRTRITTYIHKFFQKPKCRMDSMRLHRIKVSSLVVSTNSGRTRTKESGRRRRLESRL